MTVDSVGAIKVFVPFVTDLPVIEVNTIDVQNAYFYRYNYDTEGNSAQ